ncbi:hypothetical protein [Cesiribacter andamanensis]|uniref:Tetratricopeptide repeat protein n=1 Tax=Cesiribacter andamanensis AMV16 TaxID=1279009 RepID=M7NQD1_9BACT|nr:hypothetical protein ADICEAN_04160 [Cesiribacter andamanensis AMV16]
MPWTGWRPTTRSASCSRPPASKIQLANLKANLYRQLLADLRLYHSSQNTDIQLHEQLDGARILYNKGFYQQSLKMLERVKLGAQQAGLPHIALEALDFEKLIESQYITRSLSGRAETLTAESHHMLQQIGQLHALSNVSLRLYGLYIKVGHARNQQDYAKIKAFFRENLPAVPPQQAGFFEKLYYYQAQVWHHYLIHDFRSCYRYAQKWVDLFAEHEGMKERQSILYIKGMHNLLSALFNLLYYSKFREVLQQLEAYAATPNRRTNPNTEVLLFLYLYTNRLNLHFMEGRFSEGLQLVPELLEKLREHQAQLDPHWQLVFYFKIASLYFGSGDNYGAIQYLSKIIQFRDSGLREDLQCFARILNLIAHFEAGEDRALEYQIKSVYHFLGRMNDQHQMQVEIFRFLRSLGDIQPHQLKDAFVRLRSKLALIAQDPFERRPFLYLDILSWLDSKIENIPVQEVMQRKFREMR